MTCRQLILPALLLLSVQASSQEALPPDALMLTGTVSVEREVISPVSEAVITVVNTATGEEQKVVSTTGGVYEVILDLGPTYHVWYRFGSLCEKYVELNTADIPEASTEAGFALIIEMTLPANLSNAECRVLAENPIGKSSYDQREDNFTFDMSWTKRVRSMLNKARKQSRT